ncbi:MAG TPA: DUF4058 family protein [Urbifossiella sp.]|nr:DUF4058 family protein [Urbifossiella sp.]
MPSPGMNPYLEQPGSWHDFHNTFLVTMRELLTPQLLPRYVVRVEEHVYIHDIDDGRSLLGRPDVTIASARNPFPVGGGTATAELVAPAAVRITAPVRDEEHSVYLEVRDRVGGEVVTTIKLLSPSNKERGADRDAYLAKVRRILDSPANLVEIDLLRGGPRMPWGDLPACDYYAVVSRAETRPHADVWPVGLREPLPRIPIPVRAGEPAATIDLQALLHRVYDGAGFGYSIYEEKPVPRLAPDDAAWAAQFVPDQRPPGGA